MSPTTGDEPASLATKQLETFGLSAYAAQTFVALASLGTERLLSFIEAATDEIVYMTVEDLLCEKITDALWRASDRGVTIRLAGMSPAATAEIHQSIPNAEPFDSLWNWSDMSAGRLSMIDQDKTLASVLMAEDGTEPSERRDETAIWGAGETNSLVMVLKAIFTWQLDENRDE